MAALPITITASATLVRVALVRPLVAATAEGAVEVATPVSPSAKSVFVRLEPDTVYERPASSNARSSSLSGVSSKRVGSVMSPPRRASSLKAHALDRESPPGLDAAVMPRCLEEYAVRLQFRSCLTLRAHTKQTRYAARASSPKAHHRAIAERASGRAFALAVAESGSAAAHPSHAPHGAEPRCAGRARPCAARSAKGSSSPRRGERHPGDWR